MTVKTPRKKAPPTGKSTGRPTLLTPEVERELVANRELGLSWKRCCELAGIAFDTYANWIEVGKKALAKSANKRTTHEQNCIEFFRRMTKMDSEWLKKCETVNKLALSPAKSEAVWKDATDEERRLAAQTARWKLMHQAPDEYSVRTTTELTGPEGGPIQVSGKEALAILRGLVDDEE